MLVISTLCVIKHEYMDRALLQSALLIHMAVIEELASPIVSIGDPKSIVLTNQCTLIQKASPNSECAPKSGMCHPIHLCTASLPRQTLNYSDDN